MDCKISGLQEKIIDFHFGKLSNRSRSQVEAHLSQCPACLIEFFALKRDMELPADALPSLSIAKRIKDEFDIFCQTIGVEEGLVWVREHRTKILVGSLLAAASALFLLFSNQRMLKEHDKDPGYDREILQKLDEAIDSGRNSPIHINTL